MKKEIPKKLKVALNQFQQRRLQALQKALDKKFLERRRKAEIENMIDSIQESEKRKFLYGS